MEKCKSIKKCNCYCSLKQLFKFVKIKNKKKYKGLKYGIRNKRNN